MTGGKINEKVVADRALWIRQMIDSIRDLPINDRKEFLESKHKVAAAESYVRRALEALFDLGRHVLARGFSYPATEYKEIAAALFDRHVIAAEDLEIMRKMAGCRNRMVHFCQEISPEELWDICSHHLSEIELLLARLVAWIAARDG